MLIDTHAHLDAAEFGGSVMQRWAKARAAGVGAVVIPAVEVANMRAVASLAASLPGAVYALGIHPLYVPRMQPQDLERFEQAVIDALPDPRFVAVGEIGIDLFVPELRTPEMVARQEMVYQAQLKIAARRSLPVLLHVRRSQDLLLKGLRRIDVPGGLAHAFNGSHEQARQFTARGFALGLGGAMCWTRALQIRRLAVDTPIESLVLETDSPDIAPPWLAAGEPNDPGQLPRIAAVLAELRGESVASVVQATGVTACAHLPRLSQFLAHPSMA
jgi:TatD DNase family protein